MSTTAIHASFTPGAALPCHSPSLPGCGRPHSVGLCVSHTGLRQSPPSGSGGGHSRAIPSSAPLFIQPACTKSHPGSRPSLKNVAMLPPSSQGCWGHSHEVSSSKPNEHLSELRRPRQAPLSSTARTRAHTQHSLLPIQATLIPTRDTSHQAPPVQVTSQTSGDTGRGRGKLLHRSGGQPGSTACAHKAAASPVWATSLRSASREEE